MLEIFDKPWDQSVQNNNFVFEQHIHVLSYAWFF